MSLTPIFDEVCDDLGYTPIQTRETVRAPWGTTYAFDRTVLHYAFGMFQFPEARFVAGWCIA